MFSAIYVGYVVVILSQYYRSYLSKQSQKNMFYERFFIRVVIKETMVVKSNAQFNWKYEKFANLKGSNKTLKCRHLIPALPNVILYIRNDIKSVVKFWKYDFLYLPGSI